MESERATCKSATCKSPETTSAATSAVITQGPTVQLSENRTTLLESRDASTNVVNEPVH